MGTVPVDRRTHGSRLRFSSTRRRQKQKKTEKEKNAGSQDERHPRLSRDLSRPRQDHRDGEGGEVVKKLYAYVKEKKLQDEEFKMYFKPDSTMKPVFGEEEQRMCWMLKHLKGHLTNPSKK